MRIQKICLDLQFPFVCPEVIALADGDILSPTLGVGLWDMANGILTRLAAIK